MSERMIAIAAMVTAMFMFNIGDTLIKVAGVTLPSGEMMFVRGLFSCAMIMTYAWWVGALAAWRNTLNPPVLLRTVADSLCTLCYFNGLKHLKFADAAAISQFLPLMVMAGAAIFFNEKVGWRRWSSAAVGLLGVMLIIKPATSAFDPASLWIVASTVLVAFRDLITRNIPRDVPTAMITVIAAISVTVLGLLMSPFESWYVPASGEFMLLAFCGFTVLMGYIFIIIASRSGDAAACAPFRYTYIVFALLSSLFVFNESSDRLSWAGLALIVGSGLYMLHRDRVVGKRSVAPPQAAPAMERS